MIDWWVYQWAQTDPTWYSGVAIIIGISGIVAIFGNLVWMCSAPYTKDKKRAARWFLFSLIAAPVAFVFWPFILPFVVIYGIIKVVQIAW